MEVLPSSSVHYVGESDCPQQGSETAIMYNGGSQCLEIGEQVQVADVKVDDMVLDVDGSHKEKLGGDNWIVEILPTSEGHYSGDTSHLDEVDDQRLSCDFHDSDDDHFDSHDLGTGPSLASDDSQRSLDNVESGLPGGNREEAFLTEPKWLEQDEPLAVWVKWRGKWQAGIKCARADYPLSTLKAKPTHDRKKYLVVFFPHTRNYSWTDVLLVRPITEFLQPIAHRAHKVGVKMVKDVTLARRFIMQKLALGLLNTIDLLHSEALVETARNVMVWKEFAIEASRCKSYTDLGRMLLKLKIMILPRCLNSEWQQCFLQSWIQRCQKAHSAESIEMLKEELVDSINRSEIHTLSSMAAQLDMGSEWKTWKQEVMKWFSMSQPIPNGGDMELLSNDYSLDMGLPISRKRPKLEVRRAEVHASPVEMQGLHEAVSVEIDSGFFNSQDSLNASMTESGISKDELPKGIGLEDSPSNAADKWGEILVEASNSEVIQTQDMDLTPANVVVVNKQLDSANKNRQCVAFIESKGRQCVRWANDGDVYCCVHLASRFGGNSAKTVATPVVDMPMCGGTSVLGTKCKHRSPPGLSFCKKHRPLNESKTESSSHEIKLKRKHEESVEISNSASSKDIVLVGEVEAPLHVDPISVMGGEGSFFQFHEQSGKEYNGSEMLYCIGSCRQDGSDYCLVSPKRYSLYCNKHLPSWLKRARNGKSRIISKDVFTDLLKGCSSPEQKMHLHLACELFYKLFKSILSLRNPFPIEIQLQWAISEASKDVRVGEFLMKLVRSEKERLRRLWDLDADKDTIVGSSVQEADMIPVTNDGDHDNKDLIKCKICSEKFLDDQLLGTHFMENHKKEAQWLFRGYVCAICLDSFTNKKVLETHVQERHHVQFVEQCMLFQCIPCGGHFGNPEQLWRHVLSVHCVDFRLSNATQQPNLSVGEDSLQNLEPRNSTPVENANSENQGGLRKYICRFCGLKFDLLPDLGRHHQAAHMGPNSVDPRLPKRGVGFYAYRLKSGRLTRPKYKKGMGAASYRIRNRGSVSMKSQIQASNSVNREEIKVQSHVTEAAILGGLAESQCAAVANVLFSEVKKIKPRPTNSDILSIARATCCKLNLQSLLEEKYGMLPERLYLKAAKLCSEHSILVDWHQEGFICPRGCKPVVTDLCLLSPLVPNANGVVRAKSLPPYREICEWAMDESHYVIDSQHFRQDTMQRGILLCDDISFGQESIPISCVVDENLLGSLHVLADGSDSQPTYSMPWESFTYVIKPLVDQSIGLEAESLQFGCACAHSTCSSGTCDHVYLFDNDYEDAKDIYGKPMHGRFPYDEKGRIILEEGYLVFECNLMCGCSRTCQNRVLQNGVRVKLEVFRTENKGWALRAGESILRGTFVCEYIGEVIDQQEANRRRNRYDNTGCSYFYDIDAHINDISRLIEGQASYVIDATNYGNVSRYINHSCSPNLVNHQVLVESMDCQLARIGLYASRDIAVGEELTYDYQYKLLPGEGFPCHCRATNCRSRLY